MGCRFSSIRKKMENIGHILTDDIVVNYKNRDRDDCLHFLTHLDTTCKDLSLIVSPTAKRIYTSVFNAWFLKMNFNVKDIDVQGFATNKSFKIKFKENKYIYSFIDSKYSVGSVALLLHGDFGTYLYTGNFCYYPEFLKSPVLMPVIMEKAITRLYLDNTYYEQPSSFFGFHELTTKIAELIKSQPMKNFYIYTEKLTMGPLLAEIASKLEEKVYVCQSTLEIMKILGYDSYFTRHSTESRIFIDKAFIKKRGFGLENIAIYINRYSESCKSFQNIEKKGNVFTFNFYAHSNHKELCELLRILKPEKMTFIFSGLDKSKLSYDFKIKLDLPRPVLFNDTSIKPSNGAEGEKNMLARNISRQLIKPNIGNDEIVGVSKISENERLIFSENQDLSIVNNNNEVKNLFQNTSENLDVTTSSKDYVCPLRIRKVPEINNAGLSNFISEDGVNKDSENVTCNNELPLSLNEVNNCDRNTSDNNIQSQIVIKSVHNEPHPQKNNSTENVTLNNYDSAKKTLISSSLKSLSSTVAKTKTRMPLVFDPKLVKENGLNGTNSKVMQLSNIGMVSDGIKKTIILDRKYVSVKKPCIISFPKSKPGNGKDLENGKDILTKKPLTLLKSKTADSNSSMKRPNALLQPPSNLLDLTKLFHGWMDKNTVSVPNSSSQTFENSIDEPEESISLESHNFDRDGIQLEASTNNTVDNRNSHSLSDSKDMQKEHHDTIETSDVLNEVQQHHNPQTSNESNSGDTYTIEIFKKSVMDDRVVNKSSKKVINNVLLRRLNKKPLNKNEKEFSNINFQNATKDTSIEVSKRQLSENENEFCKNNCQDATKDTSSEISKQHLSENENKFCKNNCQDAIKDTSSEISKQYLSENENKFCKNNCQDATKDTSSEISKQYLSENENKFCKNNCQDARKDTSSEISKQYLSENENKFYKNNCQDATKDTSSEISKQHLHENENEFCKKNCQDAIKTTSGERSKRHLSENENVQSRKKLRSDNIRHSVVEPSMQKEPLPLMNCSVLVKRNDFKRNYFFSSQNNCYLPKFWGFKKHEVRPRNMLNTLRNLQKL